MALATSVDSARVGRGLLIIDSNICVAVITIFARRFAAVMIFFWAIGTTSGDISIPKSPRATITPFAESMIASKFSSASGLSNLATMGIDAKSGLIRVISCFKFSISWEVCTNDKAMTSTPRFKPNSRSEMSFSVSDFGFNFAPGRLIPLRDLRSPPITILVRIS